MAEQRAPSPVRLTLGLDLGQAADFTALVVDRRVTTVHEIPHVERFPLGTPYPDVVGRLAGVLAMLPSQPKPRLVVDHTGVGRAVVDQIVAARLPCYLTAVTITSGGSATRDTDRPWEWRVPKKDLISSLQVVLQKDLLKIAKGLPAAKLLTTEMQNFRMKITTAANITFEAWREGDHDDLVLAVAMAVWASEKFGAGGGLI